MDQAQFGNGIVHAPVIHSNDFEIEKILPKICVDLFDIIENRFAFVKTRKDNRNFFAPHSDAQLPYYNAILSVYQIIFRETTLCNKYLNYFQNKNDPIEPFLHIYKED